jgi:hypothetical protein
MNASTPPLALSLFLLVVGIAGLGAAILLVAVRFQPLAPVAAAPPLAADPEPPPPAPAPAPEPAVEAPAPAPAPEPAVEAPAPAPGPAAGEPGPWQVALDQKSYQPDDAGQEAIAAAARALLAEPEARAVVVGVNSTRHSSKRALAAARGVRERLVAAGVDGARVEASAEQLPEVERPLVRIERKGGDR